MKAEEGIWGLVRSRGLGGVYKRQIHGYQSLQPQCRNGPLSYYGRDICLLYTFDDADERYSVDLGGRRTIKKKKQNKHNTSPQPTHARRHRKITSQATVTEKYRHDATCLIWWVSDNH